MLHYLGREHGDTPSPIDPFRAELAGQQPELFLASRSASPTMSARPRHRPRPSSRFYEGQPQFWDVRNAHGLPGRTSALFANFSFCWLVSLANGPVEPDDGMTV